MSTSSPPPSAVAVIGAGVTGLTAAYQLVRSGVPVRVFETAAQVGGPVQTEQTSDGWLIESGPNSLLLGDAAVTRLFDELGLSARLQVAAGSARKRFLVRKGEVLALPTSPLAFVSTPLFSGAAKRRLLREVIRGRGAPRSADVSVAALVAEHLGQEWVDTALQPFVSGIYAGDPSRLSAKHGFPQVWEAEQRSGSLIRGMLAGAKARRQRGEPRARMVSLPEGLHGIPRTLAEKLPTEALSLGTRVDALRRTADGRWTVRWNRKGETGDETFGTVLLALPAGALACLEIDEPDHRPLGSLQSIEYPPVASVFLGYRQEQVRHPLDGFGVLIPESERCRILGVLFSSTLFPGRAPAGCVGLTVMLGGALHPERGRLAAPDAVGTAREEVGRLLGVVGEPILVRHRAWPQAIPQYNLGYDAFLATMESFERNHPGLLVGGHVRDGIALSACLSAGLKLADRALALRRPSGPVG
ncbi:MAG: protoporphyrinogen oxidase [Verrucomicrobia bacterium]|nr:protoporphyrinogen oxidase [Verrucomicrobiota bacterium]